MTKQHVFSPVRNSDRCVCGDAPDSNIHIPADGPTIYEYIGFQYEVGQNCEMTPVKGQHAAANKQKHRMAARDQYLQDHGIEPEQARKFESAAERSKRTAAQLVDRQSSIEPEHGPDELYIKPCPCGCSKWIVHPLFFSQDASLPRTMAQEVVDRYNKAPKVAKTLEELVDVWESLEGDQYYSPRTIERWLRRMASSVDEVRGVLKRSKPEKAMTYDTDTTLNLRKPR